MTRFGATHERYGRPRIANDASQSAACAAVTWIGPCPLKPSRRAVAAVRSYSRPPTYGPRSITRTRTTRPRWRNVTLVPHGSDLCATPSEPGDSRPPQPSLLPNRPGPYQDA